MCFMAVNKLFNVMKMCVFWMASLEVWEQSPWLTRTSAPHLYLRSSVCLIQFNCGTLNSSIVFCSGLTRHISFYVAIRSLHLSVLLSILSATYGSLLVYARLLKTKHVFMAWDYTWIAVRSASRLGSLNKCINIKLSYSRLASLGTRNTAIKVKVDTNAVYYPALPIESHILPTDLCPPLVVFSIHFISRHHFVM